MKRNFHNGLLLFLVLGLCFLISIEKVEATNFCVSTSEQLQSVLTTAATNGQNNLIQIVRKTYTGNFVYNSSQGFNLAIEGGYSAGCTSRVISPANTILDAMGIGTVLGLRGSGISGNFTVEGITLQNGRGSGLTVEASQGSLVLSNNTIKNNTSESGHGGGARIAISDAVILNNIFDSNFVGQTYFGGGISINGKRISFTNNTIIYNHAGYGGGVDIQDSNAERIDFFDNFISNNYTNSAEGGGVHIRGGSPKVNFINNLIVKNATTVYIGGGHGGGAYISTLGPVNFINNTVVENSANPVCCWGGGITIYYAANANIYNNIFWANTGQTGRDIAFYTVNVFNVDIFNNDLDQNPGGMYGLDSFIFDTSNLNKIDPIFSNGSIEDYHLLVGSPCVNAGYNDAPYLPQTDKDGFTRNVNGVDLGAYERQGSMAPSAPDLTVRLQDFQYYKLIEQIVTTIEIANYGTNSGQFKVACYLSEDGVNLGENFSENIIKKGLKSGMKTTSSCQYTSTAEKPLFGKYVIFVVDSDNQIDESIETNNRVRVRIP